MRPTTDNTMEMRSLSVVPLLTETTAFNDSQEETALLQEDAQERNPLIPIPSPEASLEYQTFEIEERVSQEPSQLMALKQSVGSWCAQDPQNMWLKVGGAAAFCVFFILLFYLIDYLSQLGEASSESPSTLTPGSTPVLSTSERTPFLSSLSTEAPSTTVVESTTAGTLTSLLTSLKSTLFSSPSTPRNTPDPRCLIPNKDCCDHGRWVC